MSAAHVIGAVLRNDGTRLLRDRFLVGASAYVIAIALALRWIIPWMRQSLLESSSAFDIAPYVPLGVSYFLVVNASVLTGIVGGMLLLETREERTIKALLVTPIPLALPLGTLVAVIFAAGATVTAVLSMVLAVGVPPWPAALASALVGAPTGVVMSLLLATIADNKVEAFAVMKITAVLGLLPVGGYFLPEPLQFITGLSPPYWACKIWWNAESGRPWAWLIAPGLLVSAAWIGILLRRFVRVAYR